MHRLQDMFYRILADLRQYRFAFFILLIYLALAQWIFHTVCPFAILFGFPCPACGLTRAGLLLLSGHFSAAFYANAAVFLWIPFLIYLIVFRYFLGKKTPFAMPAAILVCLATLLYYALRLAKGITVTVPCEGIVNFFL